jgi:hypothetical protein
MWATLVSVLLLGVGAGVLVDRFVLMPTVLSSTPDVSNSRDRHRDRGARFLSRLEKDLGLSPEQKTALEGVLAQNHEEAHAFWQQSRQEFDQLRQKFRAEIRELLNEEQRPRFEQMLAEYDARRSSRQREREREREQERGRERER